MKIPRTDTEARNLVATLKGQVFRNRKRISTLKAQVKIDESFSDVLDSLVRGYLPTGRENWYLVSKEGRFAFPSEWLPNGPAESGNSWVRVVSISQLKRTKCPKCQSLQLVVMKARHDHVVDQTYFHYHVLCFRCKLPTFLTNKFERIS